MLKKLKKWNTLRNQILFVFLLVMIIVLLIVSLLTLRQVSSLLKDNAEEQIQQVAIEASGRIESLYEQINMASKLVLSDEDVQRILAEAYAGKTVSFSERQQLMGHVNRIMGNTDGIFSFELYSANQRRVIPLGEDLLRTRIDSKWIEEADRSQGKMVWMGDDPNDKNNFLAVRQVRLLDRKFKNGGYLLISIDKKHFNILNEGYKSNQYSILLNRDQEPIHQNYTGENINKIIESNENIFQIKQHDYMVTKQSSEITGWTVLILTPVSELTSGISNIRVGIIISGIIGVFIFTICSLFLSTIITRPILKLTKTMQRAGEDALTLNPSVFSVNEISELNSTYNQLVKETNHLIQMVYQKELLRSQSELNALQAQINPHFLFNTLDALHWSLDEKNEEDLADLVLAMSDLFRYTITKDNNDMVFLKDEIKHIGDYMEIMKMRFGNRLTWHVSMPKEYEFVRIPKLIIQPLVENAILHGAGNKVGDCHITVTVEPAKHKGSNYLRITVQDNGSGMDSNRLQWIKQSMTTGSMSSGAGRGIALSNVYKRLKLYYKDHSHMNLSIESKLNKGTKIVFDLPIDGGE